jgi:hypothetical protein
VQVDEPHEFVAVHVTVVVPVANVLPEAGTQLTVGAGVPEADGVLYVTTGFAVVISPGQAPIAGLSLIVTENEQLELPHEFVAVHVTEVVPVENEEPDAGTHATVAVGVPVEVGVLNVATWLSHCVMFEGHAPITGLSLIVTEKEQLELPQEFVAVHVTEVVPIEKVEPDAGTHVTIGVGAPIAVGFVHDATGLH